MLKRRDVLRGAGSGLLLAGTMPRLAAAAAAPLVEGLPPGEYDTAVLDALPGKKPLIKLSYRPPNYETPLSSFGNEITPNDEFFVRYHLADIPDAIDAQKWRLRVGGEAAASPFELSLADLQGGFEQVELRAVCQCSGNRRGLSDPHVAGVQWGVGAMGTRSGAAPA
jgi:sulfite dehydrogenase (cytochrome) subunit A